MVRFKTASWWMSRITWFTEEIVGVYKGKKEARGKDRDDKMLKCGF